MKRMVSILLVLCLLLCGCGSDTPAGTVDGTPETAGGTTADLGDDDDTFGESLEDLNAYDGCFEGEAADITVTCISGTEGCYQLNGNTLTFTAVREDSVYSVSGQLSGNIVIDIGDDYKFDLELQGLSLVSTDTNPITVLSGDEVSLTAKNGFENYIYDNRDAVDDTDETQFSAAVYSKVDLEVCGKGALTLVSLNNNGIHSKDDLTVKNLTLLVACVDNAMKGNDSVTVKGGETTLIAAQGDGIKTTNSDISSKGNQRGTVTISGGTHTIYAACDGIDAAYDAVIDDETTVLNIYTDKYSNYSNEVTAVSSDRYYIRFTSNAYQYSVKYYNSDDDYCWVTAEYDSAVSGGRTNYYYYAYPKLSGYSKVQFFIYSSDQKTGQDTDYLVASDYLTPSAGYDTFALTSNGGSLYYEWTNYTTNIQSGMGGFGGHGGMNGGNPDKGDHSTKGIKAANEVRILAGTVNIKAYDDAIHAGGDSALENGGTATGNVTVSGGIITVYSNDDGIHANGCLTVSDGMVSVTNSYEGLEGTTVAISGGFLSVRSSDDGINGTATSGTAVSVSGGTLYVYANGDGIDSNSRTSYAGIDFSGGRTVVICTSGGNSAIDTESGYTYSGGMALAIMPANGMTSEATHCSNFSSVAASGNLSLSSGAFLTVTVGDSAAVTVQMPTSLSAKVIYLGSKSASIAANSTAPAELDQNGVCWGR